MVSQELLNHFNLTEEQYNTIISHATVYNRIRDYKRVHEKNLPSIMNRTVFCEVCKCSQKNISRHLKSAKHLANMQ